MEPAVRSPWIESAIITDRARNDALLASQDSQKSRQPIGIGGQNPTAGNGIFGCGDGRLKISLRDRKGPRRPKEGNDTGQNPHRNGPFRVGAGICGFVGLDGGVRSQAKLVSSTGTGNFLETSGQNRLSHGSKPLVIGNSFLILGSYTAIEALSCYSAKQASETQKQAG
jgi:hypothetical protein